IAVVTHLVRISDTIAARLPAVGRAAVAGRAVAVVARLAGIDHAVAAQEWCAHAGAWAVHHAFHAGRTEPIVFASGRGRVQAPGEQGKTRLAKQRREPRARCPRARHQKPQPTETVAPPGVGATIGWTWTTSDLTRGWFNIKPTHPPPTAARCTKR